MLHVEECKVETRRLEDVADARRGEFDNEIADLRTRRVRELLQPHRAVLPRINRPVVSGLH